VLPGGAILNIAFGSWILNRSWNI